MNRCLYWRNFHCRLTVLRPGVSLSSYLFPSLPPLMFSYHGGYRGHSVTMQIIMCAFLHVVSPLQRTGCLWGQNLDTFSSIESKRIQVQWIGKLCVWIFLLRFFLYLSYPPINLGTNRFEVTLEKSNKNFSKKIQQVRKYKV